MKKIIILAGLLLTMANTVLAEQKGVFMEFHGTINPDKNMEVNRSVMCIPIEVIYDTDTHKVMVLVSESLKAEVYLYNTNGAIEYYSSTVKTEFTIQNTGTFTILIQGDGWYSEGILQL